MIPLSVKTLSLTRLHRKPSSRQRHLLQRQLIRQKTPVLTSYRPIPTQKTILQPIRILSKTLMTARRLRQNSFPGMILQLYSRKIVMLKTPVRSTHMMKLRVQMMRRSLNSRSMNSQSTNSRLTNSQSMSSRLRQKLLQRQN